MKLLLIQPPHEERNPSLFPLGIGYIAQVAMDLGYKTSLLDIHAYKYSQKEVLDKIRESGADIFAICAFSTQYFYYKWLTGEIRRITPTARIVVGGPLPTFQPQMVLEKTATDVCVRSEGEISFRNLLLNPDAMEKVNGISFKKDGRIVHNPDQEYIKDLSTLPHHPYEIFPLDIYFRHIGLFGASCYRAININVSRGCPYTCHFCSLTIKGARSRSTAAIEEELRALKDKYKIDAVIMGDELALTSRRRGYELADMYARLKLKWVCQGRANVVDKPLLRRMRAAGCVSLGFGIESGSQTILNNMNKRSTVEQNFNAVRWCLEVGITPIIQFIFGYPGENQRTIGESVDFFKRLHYYPPNHIELEVHTSLITPLPGSELFGQCMKEGRIKDEEAYCLTLDLGYSRNADQLINCTEFTDKEVFLKKKEMEVLILKNYHEYLNAHPVEKLKVSLDLLHRKTMKVINLFRRNGLAGTLRKIMARLFPKTHMPASRV